MQALTDVYINKLAKRLAYTEDVHAFLKANYSVDYLPEIMSKETSVAAREWREAGLYQYSLYVQLAHDLLNYSIGFFHDDSVELAARVRNLPIERYVPIGWEEFRDLGNDATLASRSNADIIAVANHWNLTPAFLRLMVKNQAWASSATWYTYGKGHARTKSHASFLALAMDYDRAARKLYKQIRKN